MELVKAENMDDAIEKMAEIQELTKEMDAEAGETPTPVVEEKPAEAPAPEEAPTEEVAKSEAVKKAEKELLEKYASLNISAESIKDLIDQFSELKDQMTTGIDTINKRLEIVESAKGISKQANESPTKEKSVWDDE